MHVYAHRYMYTGIHTKNMLYYGHGPTILAYEIRIKLVVLPMRRHIYANEATGSFIWIYVIISPCARVEI